MQCPNCDSEVRDDANYCPDCGLDIESLRQQFAGDESGTDDEGDPGDTGVDTGGNAGASPDDAATSADDAVSAADGPASSGGQATGGGSSRSTGSDPTGASSRSSGGNAVSGDSRDRSGASGGAGGTAAGGTVDELRRTLPLRQGGVVGAVAYLVNYVVTFGFLTVELDGDSLGTGIETHEYAGWLLYNAHSVDLDGVGGGSFNWLEQMYAGTADMTIPKLAYYLLPVVVLAGAGYYLAQNTSVGDGFQTATDGAKAGATVAVGYAVLAVAGAMTVFSISSGSGTGSVSPSLTTTVVLMGVAYPVVLGGLGGYLARR